jgi:hypothetical protein
VSGRAFSGELILCVFILRGGKTLLCSQLCSLYDVIIGISYSLVCYSLSTRRLTNSLCCNTIDA